MIGRTTLLCGAGHTGPRPFMTIRSPASPPILLKGTCHDGCTPGAPPTPDGPPSALPTAATAGDCFLGRRVH